MKEDLKLEGTNLNIINTCLTVGCECHHKRTHARTHPPPLHSLIPDIIGQVPHALAIQKVPPRIWFSLMVIIWGGLTMCCAAARNFSDLCAIRFFQGVVEASTYSGTQYIIGSWYKPAEIGKRTGLFAASVSCLSLPRARNKLTPREWRAQCSRVS